MPKLTIPQIREEVKKITAALRVGDPGSTNYLLGLADIDALVEQARRSPNKPKELSKERIEAPLGKRKTEDAEAAASDLTNAIDDYARGLD
jgi:hypothetical protein